MNNLPNEIFKWFVEQLLGDIIERQAILTKSYKEWKIVVSHDPLRHKGKHSP